mgnify:CR=1 FL=1
MPERIYNITYENLVAEPKKNIQGMLEFCELPWEEACLNMHETARPVRTASSSQVRQPIYKASVERWRNYKEHLKPLLEGLGYYNPDS